MNEREFLTKLQERAENQEKVIHSMVMPKLFYAAAYWLGEHPWSFMIPLAFLVTLFFRAIFGPAFYSLILGIFGGFSGI